MRVVHSLCATFATVLWRYASGFRRQSIRSVNSGEQTRSNEQPIVQPERLPASTRHRGGAAGTSWRVSTLATVALLALGCASGTVDPADGRSLGAESAPLLSAQEDALGESGFTAITAGDSHTCGLRPSGRIACWGRDHHGQASPYFGTFRSVIAGGDQTCGIRPSGEVECWGYDMADSPLAGIFTAVSLKNSGDIWYACGLRRTGQAECFGPSGDRSSGYFAAPSGAFTAIAVGTTQMCGLRPNGTAVCWPGTRSELVPPPSGELVTLAAGHKTHCGVRPSGEVLCWNSGIGFSQKPPPSPPSGEFTNIAVGPRHACGLRPNGQAVCWGSDDFGQSSPPP